MYYNIKVINATEIVYSDIYLLLCIKVFHYTTAADVAIIDLGLTR